jgi:RNA polymerase sigma-70 factor, ECF subfamily
MAAPETNEQGSRPSIAMGVGTKLAAGPTGQGSAVGHPKAKAAAEIEPQPSARTMDRTMGDSMSATVALEADARQAAGAHAAEEQALVRRAQAGDRVAFEDLIRRYDRDVLRLAVRLVHRSEDARDIYQESFLRVYRNLHRFRFECSFYTWLYRIVTNTALDYLRRRASRPEDQPPAPREPEAENRDFFDRQAASGAAVSPEKRLLSAEIGEHIEKAMKRLSPRERMVFEMKHFQGMRLRAIGATLGTSEETAKNSLFRATRKLRASLGAIR